MTSIRAAASSLLAAAVLAWAGAATAQTVLELPPDEARVLAAQAALSGDPELAREIAAALLRADPEDRAALVVLAVAEPELGRPAQGRLAAARAFALARTPVQRFEAARLAASAAAAEGRFLLAEFWLRRALVAAPDEDDKAQALADARALRAISPWRISAELSFAPSSNVNGGAASAFNVIDGLPFVGIISVDGRALSGWTGGADVSIARRLSESSRQRTELSFRLGGEVVALSEESRDLIDEETDEDDPELTGADFSSAYAELRIGHDRVAGPALVGGDLSLGATWYGGEPYYRNLRLSGDVGLPVGEAQALRLAGFVEQRWDDEGERDDARLGVEAGWSRQVLGRDRLSFTLSRSETLSDNGNAAAASWGVRAGYDLGRSVGPARLGFDIAATVTDYPDYAVIFPVPGGRHDERIYAAIEARFDEWDLAGFAPVVTLEASRTDSNVSRFDTESVGIGFALRSTF